MPVIEKIRKLHVNELKVTGKVDLTDASPLIPAPSDLPEDATLADVVDAYEDLIARLTAAGIFGPAETAEPEADTDGDATAE